jgi:hypothetical protein
MDWLTPPFYPTGISKWPLKDLTRDELKSLMREILQELLWELEQQVPDPDEGLEFRPDIAAYLDAALKDRNRRGKPYADLVRDLGLEE